MFTTLFTALRRKDFLPSDARDWLLKKGHSRGYVSKLPSRLPKDLRPTLTRGRPVAINKVEGECIERALVRGPCRIARVLKERVGQLRKGTKAY